MLEIVHDLAPGAQLCFATADPDEAQFAQNILDLAAAGCNVIVDDVIYLDESPVRGRPRRPGRQHGHRRRRPLLLLGRQRRQPRRRRPRAPGKATSSPAATIPAFPASGDRARLRRRRQLDPRRVRRRQSAAADLGRALRPEHGHRVDRLRPLRHGRRPHDDLRREHRRAGRRRRRRLPDRVHRRRHVRRRASVSSTSSRRLDLERARCST